jgi:protein involved in polysaccharide export with SLBB domain
LADGDIVTVERREPPGVLVTGMVQQPGRYEMPASGEFRILDAVASAHGMVYKVMDTVLVCRAVPGSAERAVITVSLRAATRDDRENLLLMSGDIVSVEPNAHVLIQDALQYIRSAALGVAPVMLH